MTIFIKRKSKRVLKTRKKRNTWINLAKFLIRLLDKGLTLFDKFLEMVDRII